MSFQRKLLALRKLWRQFLESVLANGREYPPKLLRIDVESSNDYSRLTTFGSTTVPSDKTTT